MRYGQIQWLLIALLVLPGCQPPAEKKSAAPQAKVQAEQVVEASDTGPKTAGVEYISADFAKVFHEQGKAVFLDVRGDHAFNVEHIEGAISLGLRQLQKGVLPDIAKDKMIITYCGCPHSMSSQAALILQKRGYGNVMVLDEGYYHWKEQGYPVVADVDVAKSLKKMTIRGVIEGEHKTDTVYALHEPSGQLEAADIGADGRFELHLPFYGVDDGQPVRVYAGAKQTRTPFAAGADVEVVLSAK